MTKKAALCMGNLFIREVLLDNRDTSNWILNCLILNDIVWTMGCAYKMITKPVLLVVIQSAIGNLQ